MTLDSVHIGQICFLTWKSLERNNVRLGSLFRKVSNLKKNSQKKQRKIQCDDWAKRQQLVENTGKLLANLSGGREAESINSYTSCSVTFLQNLLVRYLIITILTMYLNFWQTCVTRQVSMVRVFWELWFYFNNISIQSNGGADLGFWKCSFFVGYLGKLPKP